MRAVDDHLGGVVVLQAEQVVVGGGREQRGALPGHAVRGAHHQELARHAHPVVVQERPRRQRRRARPGRVHRLVIRAVAPALVLGNCNTLVHILRYPGIPLLCAPAPVVCYLWLTKRV